MTTDRTDLTWAQPLGGGTYHGFSSGPVLTPRPMARRTAQPFNRTIAIGVVGAVALGLLLGLWARPELGESKTTAPMQPVTPAQAAKMDVEVAPAAPLSPIPRAAGKLEVLAPGTAQAASRAVQLAAAPTPQAVSLDRRLTAPPVNLDARLAPPPADVASRGNACAEAGGRAAQMVCADPELAAADRDLNRAYRRALRSGVPSDQLRDEQRDWLAIREEAARRSPRAVAGVYSQRIDELNEIAEDGPG